MARFFMPNLKDYIANFGDKTFTNRTYAISNEFGLLAIAYVDCEGDALDNAVDADLMQGHIIDDFTSLPEDTVFAGNRCEPINTDYLTIREIKNRR
jgi:hypothetical protein